MTISITISVVIPTFNRGAVLLDTIQLLLEQTEAADEILIVDQTSYAEDDHVKFKLESLDASGEIRWLRKSKPSIPEAMNTGMLSANSEWVLFIDDDVEFASDFIARHKEVIREHSCLAHVGQIVQPWQQANVRPELGSANNVALEAHLDFQFNSSEPALINNCMAGNLCVNRAAAINAGGFDENFFGVAYRFETEFCKRFCKFHDTLFRYSPSPLLDHLHIKSGGTRAHADFLTSMSPVHSMGDYYFALLRSHGWPASVYILRRFTGSIVAKFYLRKPWYVPARLIGELRGLFSALTAVRAGQKLIVRTEVEKQYG